MRSCRHGGASEAATGRAPVGSSPVRPDIPVETPKVYEPNSFVFFPNDVSPSTSSSFVPNDGGTSSAISPENHVENPMPIPTGADHVDDTPPDAEPTDRHEPETCAEPTRQRSPTQPTQAERDSHACTGHAAFRNWCAHSRWSWSRVSSLQN